jgi:hypothetical protein
MLVESCTALIEYYDGRIELVYYNTDDSQALAA